MLCLLPVDFAYYKVLNNGCFFYWINLYFVFINLCSTYSCRPIELQTSEPMILWLYLFYIGKIKWLSANRGVIVCFPGRGECHLHYSCVFMRGQTEISPNAYIFKPEYSGISCLFLQCNCDDKFDTFVSKFEDCDGQEMGEWRTKRWELFQTIVCEVLILFKISN